MYSQITSVDLIVNQTTTIVVSTVGVSKATTAGNIIPTETVVYTGAPRNFSTPTIANTIAPTSTIFNYKNKLTLPGDAPGVTTIVRNSTNQFANNKTYGGYENSLTLKSSISGTVPFSKSINLTQNYGSLSASVSGSTYTSYTEPGTYTWTVPEGVTTISLLGIGAGGGGVQSLAGGSGGTGGNLVYYNSLPVTPGDTYSIVVGGGGSPGNIYGSFGGDTYITKFGNTVPIVFAEGGYGGDSMYWNDNTVYASMYDQMATPTIYTFSAFDPQFRTITYSVSSGSLPSGITLDSSTGVLGGDPADVLVDTNYSFTVSAATTGQTIYKNFTLIVRPTPSVMLTVSPAIGGKTQWNLITDGDLNVTTAATTYTVTPTYMDVPVSMKMWGAGGGSASSNGTSGGNGGAGGYAGGVYTLKYGINYEIIVGSAGAGTSAGRTAAGGGAGTGMQFAGNSTPIIVAGGGGGGGGSGNSGTAGGGSSGQAQITSGDSPTGFPGTQAGPGAGGVGGRRTGAAGSGRNGGAGNTGSIAVSGGTGFGNGGGGAVNGSDAGSGGGGGGYYGGGEGGGNLGGAGGGGGSGYVHPTLVTSGVITAGSDQTPGNASDSGRGTAGAAGINSNSGNSGKFIIAKF